MTVAELIGKLSQYNAETQVVVKYRDENGEYDGYDDDIYLCPRTKNGDTIIVL